MAEIRKFTVLSGDRDLSEDPDGSTASDIEVTTDDALDGCVNTTATVEPVVVDFEVERASHGQRASEVRPLGMLKMAVRDMQATPEEPVAAYLSVFYGSPTGAVKAAHYRSGMNNLEEVSYRQVGLTEAVDRLTEDE